MDYLQPKSGNFKFSCANSTDLETYECHEEDRAFFVEYFSDDTNVGSIFVFSAQGKTHILLSILKTYT